MFLVTAEATEADLIAPEYWIVIDSPYLRIFFNLPADGREPPKKPAITSTAPSTTPVAALAAFETSKRISSESGIKLILSAGLASGVSLFGISMLYATTGSIYFVDITEVISASNLTILGFIFFFAGLAFKISLVPFHFWLPDAHSENPAPMSALLSGLLLNAGVYALVRFKMLVIYIFFIYL